MSDQLPLGWSQVPIGTFARVVGGGTPPSKDPANFVPAGQGIPWITPADLSGYRAQSIEHGARDLSPAGLAACGATLMPKGTVLFSSRAPIGYVAIAANEISTNQGFKSFVLPDGFDPRFTYYQFKYLKPEAEAIATGTTFKELSGAATATLPFKVAPLHEQTRIADQLDKLLARVQACNDRLDAIPALLKRFRQAVLTAATSGALTEDWRAQREEHVARMEPPAESGNCVRDSGQLSYQATPTPDSAALHPGYGVERDAIAGWRQTSVQMIAQVGTGSTPLRSNPAYFAEVGTPWITSAATSQTLVTMADEFVTSEAIAAHRLKTYPVGTLLVAMYGEGKTRGQVTELGIPATINQACAAVIVDESKANRAYVKLVLQANYFKMRELAEGGNQPNLNLSKVKEFPLALPGLPEQSEIVRRVEALFQVADRIEARHTAARAQAQRLTPLLLAKAFRGELVSQDPDDEPASALLARICGSTEPQARKPKRGKRTEIEG